MSTRILTVAVQAEHDLVLVRQRTRQLAEQLGIDQNRQTRLATAVSEISRNAFQYAGENKVEFLVERVPQSKLLVRIKDSGPGIAHLEEVMSGRYRSDTGLGLGLAGAKRLVDHFEIDTDSEHGTTVVLGLDVPGYNIEDQELLDHIETLTRTSPGNPFGEVLQQNQELLRAQNAIAEVNQELEAAQAAKDRFLAMLAHELRNLLNALRSAMEVLKRRPDEAVRERMQNVADLQVDHLGRLIEDLLDASRIVRGTLNLERQSLDVVAEVQSIVSAWEGQIAESGVELCVDLPEPPVWISADPTRLAQILGNLISNAGKFTDRGGKIEVRITASEERVTLDIEDTGCGLDDDGLQRVFEPFAQTSEAQKRMTGGLGLGLAIVKGLVEAHGGSIEATSDGLGQGLKVAMHLSPAEAPADEATHGIAAREETASEIGTRLLLVDDHQPTLESLSMLLQLDGYEVETASDGPAALEKAEVFIPSLVLCDLGLPEMDGCEVARRLKALNQPMRLIAVSGFLDEDSRTEAVEAGFETLLPKPVDFAQLTRLLSNPNSEEAES